MYPRGFFPYMSLVYPGFGMGTLGAACRDCRTALSLSAGRAVVRDGLVVQLCPSCAARPASIPLVAVEPAPPAQLATLARGPARPLFLGLVGAICIALAPTLFEPIRTLGTFLVGEDSAHASGRDARVAVPVPEPRRIYPLSMSDDGEPLEWVHPLAGPHRWLPDHVSRHFGADRDGTRSECGQGHCGVDLAYEEGLVVHAAADGFVARIVRDPDAKGGRYVKLRHPSGYSTYYMHLDQIHPDLERDGFVAAGSPIGTTGHSGILHSSPHLHFAVTQPGPEREEFLDPEPMLEEALLLDAPAEFP